MEVAKVGDKTKAKTELLLPSLCVESPYKLSNKFIEDLRKIHDFIGYFHIEITR